MPKMKTTIEEEAALETGKKKPASAKLKTTKTAKSKTLKTKKAEVKKSASKAAKTSGEKVSKTAVKTKKTTAKKVVKPEKSAVAKTESGKVGRPKKATSDVKLEKVAKKVGRPKKAESAEQVNKTGKVGRPKKTAAKTAKTGRAKVKKVRTTKRKVSKKTDQAKGLVAGREVPREEITREVPQKITPEMMEDHPEKKWFVVHTYSGYEHKVRNNLLKRADTLGMTEKIFNVIVPTEEEIEFKDGKKRTVQRKIYPGYVLVQMIMNEDSWFVVRNTAGVTSFVGPKVKPLPLPHDEVKEIFRRMGMEAPSKVQIDLEKGQGVRIIRGPFKDFSGLVEEVSPEKEKVKILITIFGRETPVELEFSQIEKL